jgi:hypothetical protein
LSNPVVQNDDQSKKPSFEALVIKLPDLGAHGPLSFLDPGTEEKIDLVNEVNVLTNKFQDIGA